MHGMDPEAGVLRDGVSAGRSEKGYIAQSESGTAWPVVAPLFVPGAGPRALEHGC